MGKKNMHIVFSSGITALTERNASFDSGVLRVAYTGRNRNNSFISKESYERCISSIYNCPIVCNYDRATDSIGSHDVELVSDERGLRFVNVTTPVGVVPESAKYWWEEIEDASGIHEYLCTEVLIWKRQEAYRKIKEDGITDESMEITVKDGSMEDGVYVIRDFEFTAFCLLGSAEPCFESASLELFSKKDFMAEFEAMKRELKESFASVFFGSSINCAPGRFRYGEPCVRGFLGLIPDSLLLQLLELLLCGKLCFQQTVFLLEPFKLRLLNQTDCPVVCELQ